MQQLRINFGQAGSASPWIGRVLLALAAAVALAITAGRRDGDRTLVGPVSSWLFVGLLQAAIGYIQYFSGVPALLVALHVTGATLLWAMTVRLLLALRCPAEAPREGDHTHRGHVVTSSAT